MFLKILILLKTHLSRLTIIHFIIGESRLYQANALITRSLPNIALAL